MRLQADVTKRPGNIKARRQDHPVNLLISQGYPNPASRSGIKKKGVADTP
jgi:hypothetical protein